MTKLYKVFIIIVMLFIGINSVNAKNDDFTIEDITIVDESEQVERLNITYDKLGINASLTFNEVGEYVKCKIILKNNTDKDYKIKDINDNYNDDYINIEYEYDDDYVEPDDDFIFYMTLKYETFANVDELKIINNILVNIKLEDLNSNEEIIKVDINPETYDGIKLFAIGLVSSSLILIVLIKKRKKLFIIPLVLIAGTTSYVYALKESYLNIQFNNVIINTDHNRFKNITNEDKDITRDNIANIYFINSNIIPDDIDGSYDISIEGDNRITAYYKQNNEMYDLYIISNEAISNYYSNNLNNLFSNLQNVHTIDLSYLDLSKATNMENMFYNDINLEEIIWPENLDTSNVTSMESMFSSCVKLKNVDVSNFDTSNVTSMKWMFGIRSELKTSGSLEYVDTSNFDTSKVTSMSYMFTSCSKLTSLDLSNFNTENVNDMNWMFGSCTGLEYLDISSFNTDKVTNMYAMFYNCKLLPEIDISSFSLENVENTEYMFMDMRALKTIYANENFKINESAKANNMFSRDTLLVGGNGTVYNNKYTNASYARIDTEETPGYFTKKVY